MEGKESSGVDLTGGADATLQEARGRWIVDVYDGGGNLTT